MGSGLQSDSVGFARRMQNRGDEGGHEERFPSAKLDNRQRRSLHGIVPMSLENWV